MTTRDFYGAPVFEDAEDFFAEGAHEAPGVPDKRGASDRVTSVSGRLLRSAVAVVGFNLLTVHDPMLAASRPQIRMTSTMEAVAAVEVPRMSPAQVGAARLIQALFEPVSAADDNDGDDPDHGF